jgi:hypothetical protein
VNGLLQHILVERDGRVINKTRLNTQRLRRRDVVALGQHLQVVLHEALLGVGQRQAHGIDGQRRASHSLGHPLSMGYGG